MRHTLAALGVAALLVVASASGSATPAQAHPPRERERRLRGFVTRVLAEADAVGLTIDEVIGKLDNGAALHLHHKWPVRKSRPILKKDLPDVPLLTGQRILDVACGTGWSTIAFARAYPNADVHGLDLDEASIELARANAALEGLEIPFDVRDAADPGLAGRYDLVACFEAVHDMARPVESLRGMRSLLADGGVVLIADERVAEQFTAPGDEVERVMYGFSLFHCMTQSLARGGPGLGTCLGPADTEALVRKAGFTRFERLDIRSLTNLFYAARP